MYHPSNPSYIQARAIKKGELKLPGIHQEMVDWISKEFNVKALDFSYDTKTISASYREQVVIVALETIADCKKIDTRENEAKIKAQVITRLQNFNPDGEADPLKKDAWPSNSQPVPHVLVDFRPLEAIEWYVAWSKAEKEMGSLKKQFDFVWSIDAGSSHQIIFFFKGSEVTDPNCDAVLNALLVILKKYDEFGYFGLHSFSTLRFDTKENFDTNYGGQAWIYYR